MHHLTPCAHPTAPPSAVRAQTITKKNLTFVEYFTGFFPLKSYDCYQKKIASYLFKLFFDWYYLALTQKWVSSWSAKEFQLRAVFSRRRRHRDPCWDTVNWEEGFLFKKVDPNVLCSVVWSGSEKRKNSWGLLEQTVLFDLGFGHFGKQFLANEDDTVICAETLLTERKHFFFKNHSVYFWDFRIQ